VPHTDDGGDGLLEVAGLEVRGARILPAERPVGRPGGALKDAIGDGLLEVRPLIGAIGAPGRALSDERVLNAAWPPHERLGATMAGVLGSTGKPLHNGELDLARTTWAPSMRFAIGGTIGTTAATAPGTDEHLLSDADVDLLSGVERGDFPCTHQLDEPAARAGTVYDWPC